MTPKALQRLSAIDIERGPLQLKRLLQDSLFYPASDIDGELIKYCNLHFSQLGICSFVYVDYNTGEDRLLDHLNEFCGYHLFAHRRLTPSDIGADIQMTIPDYIDSEEYYRYHKDWNPFAHWAVLERNKEYGEQHGPKRFSLLFLGAEGVSAYCGLYLRNDIVPKGIALIQPGHCFGMNWTNFFDWDAPLARTAKRGKSLPEYFFYGGLCLNGYDDCPWPGYNQIDRVNHYYSNTPDSAVTVWKGRIVKLKVYDGKRDSNYGVTLQVQDNAKTLPHNCNHVYVKYNRNRYEAAIGTYQRSDTLRGENTIKDLIIRNHWDAGQTFLCEMVVDIDGSHLYSILF